MREYKFRGRAIDSGRWIYGHYFVSPLTQENINDDPKDGWFFLCGKKRHCIESDGVVWEVDPKTVGEYTGLKDKNGKEIYEGDIIKRLFSDRPYSSKKRYKDGVMVVEFYTHKPSDNEHNNKNLEKDPSCYNTNPMFVGRRIDKYKYDYACCDWSEFANCEIIGNIYENPELVNP